MSGLIEQLWPAFQAECAEQMEALELALVRSSEQAPDLNALFRHFHTLKGGCAMMGFASMEAVAHACEDLLDPVRRGERALDEALVDALLAALDCLKAQLAEAARLRRDPAPAPALLARLQALATAAPSPVVTAAPAAGAAVTAAPLAALATALQALMPALAEAALADAAPPAALQRQLQAVAGQADGADAAALAQLLRRFAAAAEAAGRQAALGELLERLAALESPGLAAAATATAAPLRAALEADFRARLATLADAMAALPGTGTAAAGADAALAALDAVLAQARLLALAHSLPLLRLLRQALRECQRGGLRPDATLAELLPLAATLPGELLPGLEEDAPYVAMCAQLHEKLQQTLSACAQDLRLQPRREALATRLALDAAALAPLGEAALARLEAALAQQHHIYEIETDLEAAADRGQAFVDWLDHHDARLGNRTVHRAEGLRLAFLAALPLPPDAVRDALAALLPGFVLRGAAAASTPAAEPAAEPAAAAAPDAGPGADKGGATLRIDSTAVDVFVSRVGEMVTLRHAMAHALHRDDLAARQRRLRLLLRDRSEQRPLSAAELSELAELLAALEARQDELAEADTRLQGALSRLQEDVLALRVVPIGLVFNRLPRAVRDLAHSLGRQVHLDIQGEEVRIDKGMVDVLAEPLMHLVRNALDHGIEPPAQRLAAGKPAQATLRVGARQVGNTLFVEVADDGRGLDQERIRAQAVRQGILGAADAARLGERELNHLIFMPGFSTAEQVTEVSGRGVGMDAVKTRVIQLGGQVEVQSTPGQGARFVLKLPLSAAIQTVILVQAGARQLAVPERHVAEIISLPASALQAVQGQACALLRGATLPLYRLGELLGGDAAGAAAGGALEVVVLTDGVYRIGLVVERVLGRPEVFMRDIHPDLARLPGVGGASVLGDGRVVIILDCDKLFDLALRQAQTLRDLLRAS